MIPATTTRDLSRFRRLNSPLCEIAQNLLNALSEDSPQGTLLRAAFLPALLATDQRPKNPAVEDARLRELFQTGPAQIVVPQGIMPSSSLAQAWAENGTGKGTMSDALFVPWAVHQQLTEATSTGERLEEANLGIFAVATLAHELAHWVFVLNHGHRDSSLQIPAPPMDDDSSMYTNDTRDTGRSVNSFNSVVKPRNRDDVGDKAVLALLGNDFELISYTIGESQVIKRRFPSRRSPTMTPPLTYAIIKDTPGILDATHEAPTRSRTVPTWRDPNDSMYNVVSVLTPAGSGSYHGECTIGEEFQVSFSGADSEGKA